MKNYLNKHEKLCSMTFTKLLLFLMLLSTTFLAFTVSDYIFSNETNATISYTNFTVTGVDYSLVQINSVDTFLLKGTDLVTNQSQINSVLHSYYLKAYYPTESELEELKFLVKKFNDSRNDGLDFKNKEEYVCRDDVLLSNGKITVSGKPVICNNQSNCLNNAALLYGVYGEALGLGSPTVIVQPLFDFTPSSLTMDSLLENYTKILNSSDSDELPASLQYIKDTSPQLKPLSLKIENTIFRTPKLQDPEDKKICLLKCWAICPSFDLDQDAADQIVSKSTALYLKVSPLKNFNSSSTKLYNLTLARLDYVKNEKTAVYYLDLFSPLNQSGEAVISSAQEILSHVSNVSLSDSLNSFKSLHNSIPLDISNRNFTNLDYDIAKYSALKEILENSSADVSLKYEETRMVKNSAYSLILLLETKDLDPISMKSFELLKNNTYDLNLKFKDGMTLDELEVIKSNYTSVEAQAKDLLNSESIARAAEVLLIMRTLAKKINVGLAKFSTEISIPRTYVSDNSIVLPALSVIFFLSFASLLFLFFIYLLSSMHFPIPKTMPILGVGFLCTIIILLLCTVLLYLFLVKTSTDSTIDEFLSDFETKNSTVIVLDFKQASFSDSEAMASCAQTLADSFGEQNKSWEIYSLTSNTCTSTDSYGDSYSFTSIECSKKIENASSSFILHSAIDNKPPKLSAIYRTKAELYANFDYYESCPLVALFG